MEFSRNLNDDLKNRKSLNPQEHNTGFQITIPRMTQIKEAKRFLPQDGNMAKHKSVANPKANDISKSSNGVEDKKQTRSN